MKTANNKEVQVQERFYWLADDVLSDEKWFKKLSDDEQGSVKLAAAQHIQTAIKDFIDAYKS